MTLIHNTVEPASLIVQYLQMMTSLIIPFLFKIGRQKRPSTRTLAQLSLSGMVVTNRIQPCKLLYSSGSKIILAHQNPFNPNEHVREYECAGVLHSIQCSCHKDTAATGRPVRKIVGKAKRPGQSAATPPVGPSATPTKPEVVSAIHTPETHVAPPPVVETPQEAPSPAEGERHDVPADEPSRPTPTTPAPVTSFPTAPVLTSTLTSSTPTALSSMLDQPIPSSSPEAGSVLGNLEAPIPRIGSNPGSPTRVPRTRKRVAVRPGQAAEEAPVQVPIVPAARVVRRKAETPTKDSEADQQLEANRPAQKTEAEAKKKKEEEEKQKAEEEKKRKEEEERLLREEEERQRKEQEKYESSTEGRLGLLKKQKEDHVEKLEQLKQEQLQISNAICQIYQQISEVSYEEITVV